MEEKRCPGWRIKIWQQRLLIGLCVALLSQVHLTLWTEGFRVSAAAIVYPVLLMILMQDEHRPLTGVVAALWVLVLRTGLAMALHAAPLGQALWGSCSGALFYLCYDWVMCLAVPDRRTVSINRLWGGLLLSDLVSNLLDISLSGGLGVDGKRLEVVLSLAGVALLRSASAILILWSIRGYHRLLLSEEHERRYVRLFLMTAELKNELYFLKKNSEDIERIMTHAYQLYERLGELEPGNQELSTLALSIARDVHEVKKDNLRIVRGIEGEVAEVYDQEEMHFSDLMKILEHTTQQMLGERRADIRLERRYTTDFVTREHYRLLSVLKNLVTNAVEAIQSATGRGTVLIEERVEGDTLYLTVSDDGPGIRPRALQNLFQMGYSTKFNPETGNINRGVGLPAVKSMVEELGGTVEVESGPSGGARFQVTMPIAAAKGEKA